MRRAEAVSRCGAATRQGTPCARPARNGCRCAVHAMAPSDDLSHGIYRPQFSAIEQRWYDAVPLGSVEHELRLTRVRLARAITAELAEALIVPDPEVEAKKPAKGRDHPAIIDRLTARVESLERTRRLLEAAAPPAGADISGFEAVPYDDGD